ncbi:two pore calcium channel protein 1-like protein [Dinothrombium tinctorium]|uniref:Two pore calcium channel protein 1-like protein n=1 Tax=Dinothrombium tinctorium TaxID=1965070 RepID=A0A3S3R221_9ACAR|nr:two pore calcium channel protein 1-like protein [Dinothrombium tinctorium]RWS17508.1 two pore calcium channel protein 1-like protein [Dinothrombium tinctorium]RWS17527.1 two pore calcium channel protein 1-like protein [Dinothrombium tinctorium]
MNIILAVVYNNYRRHLKNEVQQLLTLKKENLSKAFDELTAAEQNKTKNEEQSSSIVGLSLPQFRELMDSYFSVSSDIFTTIKNQVLLVDLFWSVLEVDGKIRRNEFLQLAELFNMNIMIICVDKQDATLFQKIFPRCYNSYISKKFRSAVTSKYFRYFFDALIFLNAVFITIIIDSRMNYIEWALLAAFTFEILAKLYTFGFALFIKKFWNIFDSFVVGFAIIFWILIESKAFPQAKLQPHLDLMLILRILRLCKLLKNIERFNVVVKTIQALIPSILTYGGLLFVVFYIYAIIGMQLFTGLINGNSKNCNNNTIHCCPESAEMQYCTLNFNSIGNTLLFLFDLMVVNQWHVLAKGPEVALNSKWTRLYFVSFHLICVIIVLNIFTAFVLEAFILEYTNATEGSSFCSTLQTKLCALGINCSSKQSEVESSDFVDADHDDLASNTLQADEANKDRRFSIPRLHNNKNFKIVISEKKSVDVLLTRMFENELNIS